MPTSLLTLLKTFSWQELRHHPWRNVAAVAAVMLGVALAFAVHLINASALDEFAQAARSVGGQADLVLRSDQGNFDESIYARLASHPQVAQASPVLEVSTYALAANGKRQALRLLGVDAILVVRVAPALMPQPVHSTDRFSVFAPDSVFLNASAQALLAEPQAQTQESTASRPVPGGAATAAEPPRRSPDSHTAHRAAIQVQSGLNLWPLQIAGTIALTGAATAVMDIGAAQDRFGKQGQLTRIDLQLAPGVAPSSFTQSMQSSDGWPAGLRLAAPDDASERIGNLSRAYRVNLTVLALVALFTGAFLVFSVLSLSVAKRAQQFALLGVLGLTQAQRLRLVLLESGVMGLAGSLAGIALGTALAASALKLLGGDLGGGYFAGVAPTLQWDGRAALVYALLGILAALSGAWWPAREAAKLPLAQTLKGLGAPDATRRPPWVVIGLIAVGALLAGIPAIFGIPIAAYLSIGLLLAGGIAALPWMIAALLDRVSPWVQQRALPLLSVERARRVRASASVAVSGVVASLSLAVALTVMVASFRDSVTHWLGQVLPADVYLRTANAAGNSSANSGDTAYFTPQFVQGVAQLPGVLRVASGRTRLLDLDTSRPAVALMARQLGSLDDALPWVEGPLPVPSGRVGVYVSEAMADLYGARPGTAVKLPIQHENSPNIPVNAEQSDIFFVAGVWRDYARQGGSVAMQLADFQRLTGDLRISDMALWLQDGANVAAVQKAVRELAEAQSGAGAGELVEFASTGEIRAISLKIFDRSFAVTYWLQGVAIAIGLFGVAASFSAQVLARRKEFGLLLHLGLTRTQVLRVVAGEGLAWTLAGAIAGLVLGLGISLVLVKVVNPQSFHWTMDLAVPWLRLGLLCASVVLAGTLTAWAAGRAAAGQDAVLAVKEDW